MNYYILDDNKIVLFDTDREKLQASITFLPQYEGAEIQETEREIVLLDNEFVFADEHQEEIEQKERERLDAMTLTPADVERALYKAKNMDFDDLKQFIQTYATGIDMKALNIEFNASLFYRGAKFGNSRLFDVLGELLDYKPADMDYLFLNKELPIKNEVTNEL